MFNRDPVEVCCGDRHNFTLTGPKEAYRVGVAAACLELLKAGDHCWFVQLIAPILISLIEPE